MIKDIAQKIKAIKYCVALGFVPHMEVVVRFSADTSDKPSDLTDIDVYGILPGSKSPTYRVLFDCKTLNKMSPINRAFWARGLATITQCDEAYVILKKPALESHRLAGNSFNVRLFSEELFDKHASTASIDYFIPNSYLEIEKCWSQIENGKKNFPPLSSYIEYLNSTALLQRNGSLGLRSLISQTRGVSGELDPSKELHRALYYFGLSQFSIYVNEMVRDFNNIFDPKSSKDQFEKTLRYYLWGGKENYEIRQRLNKVTKTVKGVDTSEPFELPEWNIFVEYFRSSLDAPLTVSSTCLPIKDLAFRGIAGIDTELDKRLAARFKAGNRVRQFSLAASNYYQRACKLPVEFNKIFKDELGSLID